MAATFFAKTFHHKIIKLGSTSYLKKEGFFRMAGEAIMNNDDAVRNEWGQICSQLKTKSAKSF